MFILITAILFALVLSGCGGTSWFRQSKTPVGYSVGYIPSDGFRAGEGYSNSFRFRDSNNNNFVNNNSIDNNSSFRHRVGYTPHDSNRYDSNSIKIEGSVSGSASYRGQSRPGNGSGYYSGGPELTLGPQAVVARVGTQVVLDAGVRDSRSGYIAGEPVRWEIDQTGPGFFADIDKRPSGGFLFRAPSGQMSRTSAVSTTARDAVRLTKGTPTPADDTVIGSGHTWAVVSSAAEGTMKVSAMAEQSNNWNRRLKAAYIHWIDARVMFPPTEIAAATDKPLQLKTRVLKNDDSPASACEVVFDIVSDTPAKADEAVTDYGFENTTTDASANGSTDVSSLTKSKTVSVDSQGMAVVNLVRKSDKPGTTVVTITVIRTTENGRFTHPIQVRKTQIACLWGPGGLVVSKSGPRTSLAGENLVYRTTIRNTGAHPTGDVIVTDLFPDCFEIIGSTPEGRIVGPVTSSDSPATGQKYAQRVQWRFDPIKPGEFRRIDIVYQSPQPGSFEVKTEAVGRDVRAADSIVSQINAPYSNYVPRSLGRGSKPLTEKTWTGPLAPPRNNSPYTRKPSANVAIEIITPDRIFTGQSVKFQVYITNNSPHPLVNAQTVALFSPGLVSPYGASPLQSRPLGIVNPGQTRTVNLDFQAVNNGNQTFIIRLLTESKQVFTRTTEVIVEPSLSDLAYRRQTPHVPQGPPPVQAGPAPAISTPTLGAVSPSTTASAEDKSTPQRYPLPGTCYVPRQQNATAANSTNHEENTIGLKVSSVAEAGTGQEFNIQIDAFNPTSEPIRSITVSCFLDPSFKIVQYTEGLSRMPGGDPFWLIPEIKPGQRYPSTLVVRCNNPGKNRVCRFSAISVSGDAASDYCSVSVIGNQVKADTNAPVGSAVLPGMTAAAGNPSMNPAATDLPVNVQEPSVAALPNNDLASLPGLAPLANPSAPAAAPAIAPDTVPNTVPDTIPDTVPEAVVPAPPILQPGPDDTSAVLPGLPNLPDLNSTAEAPLPGTGSSATGLLKVELSSPRTVLKMNQRFTCQVTMTNQSSETMTNVQLALFYPAAMFHASPLGTAGPAAYKIETDSGKVIFEGIEKLDPGQSVSFEIRLLPTKRTTAEFAAQVLYLLNGQQGQTARATILRSVE